MASDPYRYFRIEARELVDALGQSVFELERGSPDAEVVGRLLRFAHTLKGAARVVKQLEIAELSHQMEEIVGRARDASRLPDAGELRELLGSIDRIGALIQALAAAPSAETPGAPSAAVPAAAVAPDEVIDTVRIEIEEMDGLLRSITETGVQLSNLRRGAEGLEELLGLATALSTRLSLRGRNEAAQRGEQERALAAQLRAGLERVARSVGGGIERVAQELGDLREGADRLRLVPAEVLVAPLARVARDAAQALGRKVSFELVGGELRVDAHVLAPLRDALVQLVRNAVAHGIENPAERSAADKPAAGTIRIEVARRAGRVAFSCRDDGKGIDIEAVRRELRAKDALDESTSDLSEKALLERLLSAGLTTTREVTQHSGRGIGLDVVREVARRLKGEVTIDTERGRGTTVAISVPLSLAALRALVVEAGGATLVVPLASVVETVRLAPSDFRRSADGDSVAHGAAIIPFMPLARALRLRERDDRLTWSTLVISDGGRSIAVGVDRLLGAFDVVVRPLPAVVAADPIVGGATFDAEGNPRLVLDPAGLVAAVSVRREKASASPPERKPILVIDDSLTTRMLEQSILESAGYEVTLAVSAEQGLEKARQARYGLFIVDVEMPGMDGFEFVRRTRADPELGKVPAILVTSRHEPEDLKRGREAGASAYIVKGEFDQNLLLSRIRELVG